MPKTLEQAKQAANVGRQFTGGSFCVIPDPDCAGFYMSIPTAQHDSEIDPPAVYTAKGKIY